MIEKRSLKIKCKLAFIDYEGRSDGDSVKKIIAHCKPKQLILVRSSDASAKAVVDYCINDAKVFISFFPYILLDFLRVMNVVSILM